VQTRITGFLDNWPKLEKWFTKFGILRKVDASLEDTPLYLETEHILEDTLDKVGNVIMSQGDLPLGISISSVSYQ